MESRRQQKIARLIQKELSILFQQQSRELFQGRMISVTVVRISPDLSFAKIYLSVFGDDVSEFIKYMNEITNEVKRQIGSKLRNQLRKIPDLRFYEDDSLDYAENIENLLKK